MCLYLVVQQLIHEVHFLFPSDLLLRNFVDTLLVFP